MFITSKKTTCAGYSLSPKWLARRPEALRSGGSVWSAVASGIPQSNTIFNKVLKICDTIFL